MFFDGMAGGLELELLSVDINVGRGTNPWAGSGTSLKTVSKNNEGSGLNAYFNAFLGNFKDFMSKILP